MGDIRKGGRKPDEKDSEKFDKNESKEVSFKGNVYDFSVNYVSIDKSKILHINKYLIVKNNVK